MQTDLKMKMPIGGSSLLAGKHGKERNIARKLVKAGFLLAVVGLICSLRTTGSVRMLFRWEEYQKDILAAPIVVTKGWRWNELVPSHNIEWHHCHEGAFDCARLNVPLNWLNQSDARKATLAIIRLNATERADYKGPLFINPGGPGGSGVWYVKYLGSYYQSIVGKNYDIISFDPRGIGATLPSISCWDSSTSEFLWSMSEPPVLDAYPGALYEAYAHATAFSQQCVPQVKELGKYLTTASLARDMLHINEKLGEAKVKYWGFSYGTYIAATFAALFPDKVGRIVSDGNVDAVEFASGVGTGFVADTDAVMDGFFFHCHRAGPKTCAMYDVSPESIQDRIDALLEDIRMHPVVVPASSSNMQPEIVTFSKVRKLITSCLYQPLATFPLLDKVLAALEKGDGQPYVSLTVGGQELQLCDSESQEPGPELEEAQGSTDGGTAILCTDAAPLKGGVEAFAKYLAILEGISKVGGAAMAQMALICAKWPVKAKWRFAGPFQGNTSHPILFVANTADNVTPLRSAQQNAKGFPGSVILISDSYGHTSLSTPSRCIASKIRAYFQTGELPPPNTICTPDLVPFEKWNLTGLVSMSAEEIELEVAMRKLMMIPIPGVNFDVRL